MSLFRTILLTVYRLHESTNLLCKSGCLVLVFISVALLHIMQEGERKFSAESSIRLAQVSVFVFAEEAVDLIALGEGLEYFRWCSLRYQLLSCG